MRYRMGVYAFPCPTFTPIFWDLPRQTSLRLSLIFYLPQYENNLLRTILMDLYSSLFNQRFYYTSNVHFIEKEQKDKS